MNFPGYIVIVIVIAIVRLTFSAQSNIRPSRVHAGGGG